MASILQRCLEEHHFNHGAEIVMPWMSTPDSEMLAKCDAACSSEYFWRVQCSVTALLQPEFISNHLRQGTLCAISATSLDAGGSLAVTPAGVLLIVCTQHIFEALGLSGQSSAFGDRHCVSVPLLSQAFAPGQPSHGRLMEAAHLLGEVVMLLVWQVALAPCLDQQHLGLVHHFASPPTCMPASTTHTLSSLPFSHGRVMYVCVTPGGWCERQSLFPRGDACNPVRARGLKTRVQVKPAPEKEKEKEKKKKIKPSLDPDPNPNSNSNLGLNQNQN